MKLLRILRRRRSKEMDFVYSMTDLPQIEIQQAALAFARLFATEDGKKVLSYLQAATFYRALGPDSTDEHIRYLEGQRALLSNIMRMIYRGRQGG